LLGRFAPHYQRDLVVHFCVFLGGVLLVLGSVQVMAVRDLSPPYARGRMI
jgi:hypothetical protein